MKFLKRDLKMLKFATGAFFLFYNKEENFDKLMEEYLIKDFFKTKQVNDSILRPLGAGLSVLYPLIVGVLVHNMYVAQIGILGAFSYLAFQRRSIVYNIKATSIHSVCLIVGFLLGSFVAHFMFLLPFAISIISFLGFMVIKIFKIPKPGHFFVVMLFATATSIHLSLSQVPSVILYLGVGTLSGLLNAVLISFIEKLPWKSEINNDNKLSLKDKYYVLLYEQPKILLDGITFTFVLFVAGYIAYLLRNDFGYWVLISSAAVLSGEELKIIKTRYHGRIVGSIVGLLIGAGLTLLNLSIVEIVLVLMLLNILVEYFMPRNYALANFFTNPLVILMSLLTHVASPTFLILSRLNGIVLGSIVAALLIKFMSYALRINNRDY
ncbi:hypothetical protein RT41_GL000517 [Lactococcus fujiensis JCM 16395]|uniref:Integral membrane bound transporter domain-containing protein n=1 Tax=Lactococcus fujiensis JCM 16395 TaxID=1291764 RepID=A0A2A5RJ14_9LACT|nr:hypothetical protein RT41_GL000517 [Lactococcus fujiensis JCM 16395]